MTKSKKMRRAADREALAAELITLANRVGASIERDDSSREIVLHLYLDGAGCMIILSGDELAGLPFMAHWHFEHTPNARRGRLYAASFDGAGYHPHHKATTMVENATEFLTAVKARFNWIADGTAFTTEAASR